MIRKAAVLMVIYCLFGLSARAQTLQSIAISPAGPFQTFYTGSFITFTAMGTFSGSSTPKPIFATWTSSNPSAVSIDNATGTATALQGTAPGAPVTITATSGGFTASVTIPVVPQTALYAVDGNNNLYIYDNTEASIGGSTINENPPLVTTVPNYQTTTKGVNGSNPVPMVLSHDQRYLYIANPAYSSSNTSDFAITVIDTQNNYAVVQTVSIGSGPNILTDGNLCYPTSIAVGLNFYKNFANETITTPALFVVNAGTSVAQGSNAASCSSVGAAGNVQVFFMDKSSGLLTLIDTITSADLVNAPVGSIPAAQAADYIPLLVAASSDQKDETVYVSWTAIQESTGGPQGIITPISLNPSAKSLNGSSNPNWRCSIYPTPPASGKAVCDVIDLYSGTAKSGHGISPITLSVATTYPTWNFGEGVHTGVGVHTVLYTGQGYDTDTTTTPTYSDYTSWGYFSDACDEDINASCQAFVPALPQSIFAGPAYSFPAASTSSPNGYVYAVSQFDYLELFEPGVPDPKSGQLTYQESRSAYTTQGDVNSCTSLPTPCVPLTGIASRADATSLFLGASGQFTVVSPPPNLTSEFSTEFTNSTISPLGLLISQAPEVQLFLSQSYSPSAGGTVINSTGTYFTMKGNFQNDNFPMSYPVSCDWGNGSVWSSTETSSSENLGELTAFPGQLPGNGFAPYSGTGSEGISPAVMADASGLAGTIIGTTSVGPPMTMISPAATTPPNSVPLGGTNQLAVQVTPAGSDGSIATWFLGPALAEAPCPGGPYSPSSPPPSGTCQFGYVDANNIYNAPSVLPAQSVSICALPNAFNGTPSGVACSNTGPNSGPNMPYSNTISLTLLSPAATPTFSPAGGTYTGAQTVSISDATNGATIYYTTDGTAPTTSSPVYSGPITVSSTETLEAIAAATGYTNSTVASATYTIALPAPTFSPAGGTYTGAQTVSISDATSGAAIYYTTNGTAPTTSSSVYSGPITVSSTETLEAIAVGTGYANSAVASATYTIALPAPTFSPASGTYTSAQTVSISEATSGATIYYTTNGTAPTTSSPVYSGPITVSSTETLEAIAVETGYTNSAVTTVTYTIAPQLPAPTFSPAGGTYTSAQTISISDATSAATIYYTTNGATPTTSSSVYSGPVTVSSSETLKAIAVETGYTNSAAASATYIIALQLPPPTFSPPGGPYTSAQTVTISDATGGATIYYTTNGATPTTSSTTYSGPVTVSSSETLEAVATASGYSVSPVGSATYTIIQPATATLSATSLTFSSQSVGTTSTALTVSLANSGQAALTVTSIVASGDFAETNTCGASVAGGKNCTISVTFTPTATGTRNGTLTITDSATGSPQAVTLSGTGVVPTATLSATSLTFSTPENVGTTSGAETVTLTNTGQAALVLSGTPLAITGVNASDFTLAPGTTCTASLSLPAANASGTGGSCVIAVAFTPSAVGQRIATVQITDNSGGVSSAAQTVSLSGSGQLPVTITLYPSSLALEPGATQTFTPIFQPTSAGGPVTWTLSGSGCSGQPCGTLNSSGTYTAPATLVSPAVDTVTATLVSNQTVSASTPVTLFLTPSISSGQSETVSAGGAATYQLTLAANTGNANGTLTVECFANTLPTGVSCQSVTVQPGTSAPSFAFVVQTTGASTTALISANKVVLAGALLIFPVWLLPLFRKRRTSWLRHLGLVSLPLLSAAGCCLFLSSCGTNGSFGQTATKTFTSTPSGTYTIQLSGVEPNGMKDPNIGTITLVVQ